MKLFLCCENSIADAVSCVADRDGKRRSLEVRDDGDSGLTEWFAEKVELSFLLNSAS